MRLLFALILIAAGADAATYETEEAWRISGEDDRFLFGLVSRVVADDDGNVYLLDSQLSEVTVLDEAGRYLRRIGGEGDGPGELRRPADLFFYENGDLGVVLLSPPKIVRFAPDGTHLEDLNPLWEGRPLRVLNADAAAGRLAVFTLHSRFGDGSRTSTYRLAFLRDGALSNPTLVEGGYTLAYESLEIDEAAHDMPLARWALADDGTVYVAPDRERYRVVRHAPDGAIDEWTLDRAPRKRNDDERAAAESGLRQIYRHARYARAAFVTSPVDPMIVSLRLSDDDERLWVLTGAGAIGGDGVFHRYDVVAVEGRLIESVDLRLEGDPSQDALHWLSDDHVVVVEAVRASDAAATGVEDDDADVSAPDIVCRRLRRVD